VQFLKFRLSGFKSFVDPTELGIDAGLTGIVGGELQAGELFLRRRVIETGGER